jgi:3-hydroxyisobutyrate dehydrogenase-like beta-hydroxyacid dehydrogenase
MEAVAGELAAHGEPGRLPVAAGTHGLGAMRRAAAVVEAAGPRLIDAPVVYGALGITPLPAGDGGL